MVAKTTSPWAYLDECHIYGFGVAHLCSQANADGSCDVCDTIDGRGVEAVAEYASTCDTCGELCMHVLLRDRCDGSQLGDCPACRKKQADELRKVRREARA